MSQKIYTLTCQYDKCGKQFEATQYWARYCCDSHRQLAYEQRKAEKETDRPAVEQGSKKPER